MFGYVNKSFIGLMMITLLICDPCLIHACTKTTTGAPTTAAPTTVAPTTVAPTTVAVTTPVACNSACPTGNTAFATGGLLAIEGADRAGNLDLGTVVPCNGGEAAPIGQTGILTCTKAGMVNNILLPMMANSMLNIPLMCVAGGWQYATTQPVGTAIINSVPLAITCP